MWRLVSYEVDELCLGVQHGAAYLWYICEYLSDMSIVSFERCNALMA